MEIEVLARQGKGIREISRLVGRSRKAVRRVLRGQAKVEYGPRKRSSKKLDPFVEYVRERLEQAKPERLTATVLLRELRERGYDGGYSQLKVLVAGLRPAVEPEPIVRFETPPGKQCQIDFVTFRRRPTPLLAFTAKLGYSRYGYAEFADNERVETLIRCLENAFEFFGGATLDLLCDNPKTIVLHRDAYGAGRHRYNPLFLDFVRHYGVRPLLCHPYRAQTKGKVERFHRYVRESFYIPLMSTLKPVPLDVATANREVQRWLGDIANVRIHGTTKEQPLLRWQHERMVLLPLPPRYIGQYPRRDQKPPTSLQIPVPIESLQHPLSSYAELAMEIGQ